jgi:hypothetical protein
VITGPEVVEDMAELKTMAEAIHPPKDGKKKEMSTDELMDHIMAKPKKEGDCE